MKTKQVKQQAPAGEVVIQLKPAYKNLKISEPRASNSEILKDDNALLGWLLEYIGQNLISSVSCFDHFQDFPGHFHFFSFFRTFPRLEIYFSIFQGAWEPCILTSFPKGVMN